MTIEQDDKDAGAVAVAPRVTLADIEGAILLRYHTTAYDALRYTPSIVIPAHAQVHMRGVASLELLSLCILVLKNGYTIVGKSAPASAENFNAELGKRLAYEDAIRQIWPLMGFALRDRLHEAGK